MNNAHLFFCSKEEVIKQTPGYLMFAMCGNSEHIAKRFTSAWLVSELGGSQWKILFGMRGTFVAEDELKEILKKYNEDTPEGCEELSADDLLGSTYFTDFFIFKPGDYTFKKCEKNGKKGYRFIPTVYQ